MKLIDEIKLILVTALYLGIWFAGLFAAAFHSTYAAHVWSNIICVSLVLLIYNASSVIRRNLVKRAFIKLFHAPIPTASA